MMSACKNVIPSVNMKVLVEKLALPISDHQVLCTSPAGGRIQLTIVRFIIAHNLSFSPFHRLDMTFNSVERNIKQ